jgi:(S)-sulfolactate dehydrogenase
MGNILITEFMDPKQVERLSLEHNVSYEPELYLDSKALLDKSVNAQALIVRNKTNVDKELLDSVKDLKIIGRLGVGLDNIDISYCKEKNVPIVVAEGANAKSVCEYIIMGLLTLFRGTGASTESILKGKWDRSGHIGSEINGKTLGIVGIGTIGRTIAENARTMGMNLIGNDIEISDDDEIWRDLSIECCSFEDLIQRSDAITLHIPLNQETHNLFNEDVFKKMQKGSFIINTSRGGIVNESDLLKYLENGHLGGGMLDVFENEPIKNPAPFSGHKNLILTPHIAGLTVESNVRVSQSISDKILDFLISGEKE